jgi:hypothetical protein
MKALLFAAAISVSGIAIAQDTSSQDTNTTATQGTDTTATQGTDTTAQDSGQPSGQTVDDPSQSTGPQGVTQQGTDPSGQATSPAGTNQAPMGTGMAQPMPNQQAAFTPRPAAGDYPPCSRTVTDACTQTYERGVRRSRPRR